MTLPGLPSPSVPLMLPNGSVNPDWYRYLVALDKIIRSLM